MKIGDVDPVGVLVGVLAAVVRAVGVGDSVVRRSAPTNSTMLLACVEPEGGPDARGWVGVGGEKCHGG
jgi:hypothetical protein